MEGTPFGRYRLVEMLGRGGMGEVWRTHDTATNRLVAIKLLAPHLADDDRVVRRFRREAEAAAGLNSPHIIPIYDYGMIDDRLYVSMRLVDGHDLGDVLREGPMPPERAVRIVEQVAKGLHAAHRAGLVHRDVKPSNILLDEDDFAYLIDFGIARALDDTRLTGTGNAIGTFHYLAPERLDNSVDDDARGDVYALACVLHECLTGSTPFDGESLPRLISAHLHVAPPLPSSVNPRVTARFDDVIATGMAKDPEMRYPTTLDLARAAQAAITEPLHPPPPHRQPFRAAPTQVAPQSVHTQPMREPPRPVPPPAQRRPTAPRRRVATWSFVVTVIALALNTAAVASFATGFLYHKPVLLMMLTSLLISVVGVVCAVIALVRKESRGGWALLLALVVALWCLAGPLLPLR